MTHDPTWKETEADDWFREDAKRLGYIKEDAHAPGNGRGLWAYYSDHGMKHPEQLRRSIPGMERPWVDEP